MRSQRFLSNTLLRRGLLLLAPGALLGLSTVHCGSDPANNPQPIPDVGAETDPEAGDGGSDAEDGGPDATPSVTCTKSPAFQTAVKVNHNPDSLRRVANAGMVLLEDGRIMVAMLEAVDTGTRYALWARTVDPTSGAVSADERLDVDGDALTDASGFQVFAIANGAVGVRYGDVHLRVWSKGKWSPDLAGSMPIVAGDELAWIAAPSGQVLVTRSRGTAPYGEAVVYRPDEGGTKGSWTTPTSLDLDGASGKPRIDRAVLSDGRFLTMIWQGAGGPAIRIRSLSGAWSTPFSKAEIGATDASPSYRVMDDGSIVLVALEGSGDTRRVVTSTWSATDGWTTARLLSKPNADTNGVIPAAGNPFLFTVSGKEVEFVAWVAACAGVAKDCTFQATSRRYVAGTWKDPVDLAIGETMNGADGASVLALDASTPLVVRYSPSRNAAEFRIRTDAGDYKPKVTMPKDSPLFGMSTQIDSRFYAAGGALWTLTRRDNVPDGGTPTTLAMAAGKIDPSADKIQWTPVTAGSYELRAFSDFYPYADGSGGFTVGANSATDGSSTTPIIAHSNNAETIEATAVISSDEKSASFVNVPRGGPRAGRDRAALFVVAARPSDTTVTTNRLRAYAYNGVGSGVPRLLANETRAPRTFGDGMLIFGCGGAILYAEDPADGSHTLQLVVVKEPAGS
jgi:hypothetical protein